MIVIRHLKTSNETFERSVVTIGNFDGVHLGHQQIFDRLIAKARELDARSVAYTFEPHPMKVLRPEKAPAVITPLEKKVKLIRSLGVDVMVCERFTTEFSAQLPEEFVREVLVDRLRAKHVFVGYDYRFGKDRAGGIDLMRELGGEWGFSVEVIEAFRVGGEVVSSTRIRELVSAGDVRGASDLLGRHFFFKGRVAHGEGRGKKMGFPTANLIAEMEVLPPKGVYAVRVDLEGTRYYGAMNIGVNPTFEGNRGVQLEVFMLDYDGDLYGKALRVHFVERVRDERKFPSVDALVQQITQDVDKVKEILEKEERREFAHPYGPGD